MRRFYLLLNVCRLALVVSFSFAGLKAFAQDMEIDLSGNASPASKSTPVLSKQQSPSDEVPLKKKPVLTTAPSKKAVLRSVVRRINVSTENDGTQVFIEGENLTVPSVEKTSAQKILIKFTRTKLSIPSKISIDNEVIKNIRSAPHGSTAWIVLDVKGVEKWNVSKTQTGYSILLNSGELSAEPNVSAGSHAAVTTTDSATGKRLFSRLIDTSFKPVEKGIKVVLTADGPSKYTVRKLSRPEKLVIRFHDTKLEVPEKAKKVIGENPESKRGGLLLAEFRQIGSSFSPISEAILTLVPGTVHQIDRDLNQIVITLSSPLSEEKPSGKRGNINQLVSLDIEGADLSAVVKTLASEAGFDVDLSLGGIAGSVNEKFKDVPLKTALATLLAPGNYAYEIQGNAIRIGTQDALRQSKINMPHVTELISPTGGMTLDQFNGLVRQILKPSNALNPIMDTTRNVIVLTGTPADIDEYKKAIRDLKLDESGGDERINRIVKLNYADASALSVILAPYLTPIGRVQLTSDQKLIIREVASNMGVLLELIKELDHRPAQVLIESSIVEVNNEKALSLGVVWSANKTTGDPTFSSGVSIPPQNSPASPANFVFGTIRSGLNINARLQAMEGEKKGKVISRPRIATSNGVAAQINTVENVVISSTSTVVGLGGALVTTTTFSTLALPINLNVTPRITEDGRITTVVNASITSQSGPAPGPGAPPPTNIQTATTTITTKNGETIVIGGLVREISQEVINGIPLLSSLPIIGALFQQRERQNRKVELVIFITPTLLED